MAGISSEAYTTKTAQQQNHLPHTDFKGKIPFGATRIGAGLTSSKGFKCFDAFLREDKRVLFKEVGHRPGDFGKS
ncbi:hypothetical protein Tco_0481238 [Tanacetum coccineum]